MCCRLRPRKPWQVVGALRLALGPPKSKRVSTLEAQKLEAAVGAEDASHQDNFFPTRSDWSYSMMKGVENPSVSLHLVQLFKCAPFAAVMTPYRSLEVLTVTLCRSSMSAQFLIEKTTTVSEQHHWSRICFQTNPNSLLINSAISRISQTTIKR